MVKRVRLCVSVVLLTFFVAVATTSSSAQLCPAGTVCVTTWQNDTYRTGDNLSESKITTSSIQSDNFGQLCSVQNLDGQVYAQPLVVTNVAFQNQGTFDVVYVVTENDTLYAINAIPQNGNGTCQVLGSLPFLTTTNLPTYGRSAVPCAAIDGPDCLGGCTNLGAHLGKRTIFI